MPGSHPVWGELATTQPGRPAGSLGPATLASPRFTVWVVAAIAGVLVAGGIANDTTPARANSAPSSRAHSTLDTNAPSTTTTTVPDTKAARKLIQPAAVVLPAIPAEGLTLGANSDVVRAYEQRMKDVKLDPGPVDGTFSTETQDAVYTIQRIMGVPTTGVVGAAEADFIAHFKYLEPLHGDAEPNRTEIDVARQLLTLYQNYQVRLVTLTSTGSGVQYCYDTPIYAPTRHVCEVANTPSGRFTYYSEVQGWQNGDLGTLYNPMYFVNGIAVHGADRVSLTPASFGCANIPMHIAKYFPQLVSLGDVVYVDGGSPVYVISSGPATGGPSTASDLPPDFDPATTTTTAPPESTTTTTKPEESTTTTAAEESTTTTKPEESTTTTVTTTTTSTTTTTQPKP